MPLRSLVISWPPTGAAQNDSFKPSFNHCYSFKFRVRCLPQNYIIYIHQKPVPYNVEDVLGHALMVKCVIIGEIRPCRQRNPLQRSLGSFTDRARYVNDRHIPTGTGTTRVLCLVARAEVLQI